MGSSKKAESRRLAGNSNLSLIQAKGAAIEKASTVLPTASFRALVNPSR